MLAYKSKKKMQITESVIFIYIEKLYAASPENLLKVAYEVKHKKIWK